MHTKYDEYAATDGNDGQSVLDELGAYEECLRILGVLFPRTAEKPGMVSLDALAPCGDAYDVASILEEDGRVRRKF